MRALIIDDSSTVRLILRRLLEQLQFQVDDAADGRQGLERLAQIERPDVVLVDWNMPHLDGLGFIRAVRAEPAYQGLRVLMVTTENEKEQLDLAVAAGADEFIMKPFDRETVRQKLAQMGLGS